MRTSNLVSIVSNVLLRRQQMESFAPNFSLLIAEGILSVLVLVKASGLIVQEYERWLSG
jgi:hypothetical protein